MGDAGIVTIDGPAGAGKSTVARLVAERLGIGRVDTGAVYRAVSLFALDRALDDEAITGALAVIDLEFARGRVLLEKRDVTEDIRTPRVTEKASRVGDPAVRAACSSCNGDSALRSEEPSSMAATRAPSLPDGDEDISHGERTRARASPYARVRSDR